MTKANSHFKRGSAVFNCRSCGRATRATGRGDNEHALMCAECFDLGGEENHLSDSGKFYGSPQNVLALIKSVADKGGNASRWDDLKAEAEKALAGDWEPEAPDAWKKADDALIAARRAGGAA